MITGGGVFRPGGAEGMTTGGAPGITDGDGATTGGTITVGAEGGSTTVGGGALVTGVKLVTLVIGRTVRGGKLESGPGGAWTTSGTEGEGLVFPARASRRACRRTASWLASGAAAGVGSGASGCAHATAQNSKRASKVVFTVVWGWSLIYWWTRRVLCLEWLAGRRASPQENSTSRQGSVILPGWLVLGRGPWKTASFGNLPPV